MRKAEVVGRTVDTSRNAWCSGGRGDSAAAHAGHMRVYAGGAAGLGSRGEQCG